jgi:hypothetical protein
MRVNFAHSLVLTPHMTVQTHTCTLTTQCELCCVLLAAADAFTHATVLCTVDESHQSLFAFEPVVVY